MLAQCLTQWQLNMLLGGVWIGTTNPAITGWPALHYASTDRWEIKKETWINEWRAITNANTSIKSIWGHWMVWWVMKWCWWFNSKAVLQLLCLCMCEVYRSVFWSLCTLCRHVCYMYLIWGKLIQCGQTGTYSCDSPELPPKVTLKWRTMLLREKIHVF